MPFNRRLKGRRYKQRDHLPADFYGIARSARGEEEQYASKGAIDVIGKTRKTFRIPPRVLNGDADVVGFAQAEIGEIIAQAETSFRQQVVRIIHLGREDIGIQEAKAGGGKLADPHRFLAFVGDLEIGHQLTAGTLTAQASS